MCVCVCVSMCVSMCVCACTKCVKETKQVSVFVSEAMCVCVCVCEREKEREREMDRECVRNTEKPISMYMYVCAFASMKFFYQAKLSCGTRPSVWSTQWDSNSQSIMCCWSRLLTITLRKMCILNIEKRWSICVHVFTNTSVQAGSDTRSIFKQSLTDVNSEFLFS